MNNDQERMLKTIRSFKDKDVPCEIIFDVNDMLTICSIIEGLEIENQKVWQRYKEEYEQVCKALEILGNYKHYCVPDELSNRENENLVDKAYMILGGKNNE